MQKVVEIKVRKTRIAKQKEEETWEKAGKKREEKVKKQKKR